MINISEEDFDSNNPQTEIFPWKDVNACRLRVLDAGEFVTHKPCPGCGCPSEHLNWIEFVSPPVTWERLYGRQGPLSICTECNIQVEFITVIMN